MAEVEAAAWAPALEVGSAAVKLSGWAAKQVVAILLLCEVTIQAVTWATPIPTQILTNDLGRNG